MKFKYRKEIKASKYKPNDIRVIAKFVYLPYNDTKRGILYWLQWVYILQQYRPERTFATTTFKEGWYDHITIDSQIYYTYANYGGREAYTEKIRDLLKPYLPKTVGRFIY